MTFTYQSITPSSATSRCIYIAPENLEASLSGGHIESFSDLYFLSQSFKSVLVVYPRLLSHCTTELNSIEPNSTFTRFSNELTNIRFIPVTPCVDSNLFLLSRNRPDYSDFLANLPDFVDLSCTTLIIACSRNFSLFFRALFSGRFERIVFKSYGSIFIHNFANILCFIRHPYIDKKIFSRIYSCFLYSIVDPLLFFLSDLVVFARSESDVKNNCISNFFFNFIQKKVFYGAATPYYCHILHRTNSSCIASRPSNLDRFLPLKIGCIGDNTFPTAVSGVLDMLNTICRLVDDTPIHIFIAGKITPSIRSKFLSFEVLSPNVKIICCGYIDSVPEFYNNLDGLMIPVGGGSALPNKAVEAFSSFHGPILISPYIFSLRSSFPGLLDRKNIFSSTSLFLSLLINSLI